MLITKLLTQLIFIVSGSHHCFWNCEEDAVKLGHIENLVFCGQVFNWIRLDWSRHWYNIIICLLVTPKQGSPKLFVVTSILHSVLFSHLLRMEVKDSFLKHIAGAVGFVVHCCVFVSFASFVVVHDASLSPSSFHLNLQHVWAPPWLPGWNHGTECAAHGRLWRSV